MCKKYLEAVISYIFIINEAFFHPGFLFGWYWTKVQLLFWQNNQVSDSFLRLFPAFPHCVTALWHLYLLENNLELNHRNKPLTKSCQYFEYWLLIVIVELEQSFGPNICPFLTLKAELDYLPLNAVRQSKAVLDSCAYNSVLMLTVEQPNKRVTQVYMFQCEETGVSHMAPGLWPPDSL